MLLRTNHGLCLPPLATTVQVLLVLILKQQVPGCLKLAYIWIQKLAEL
jgi:hypothetical protein